MFCKLFYYIFLKQYESILLRYQGYEQKRISKWFISLRLPFSIKIKLLKKIDFYDAKRIRKLISNFINTYPTVFMDKNVYVTSFGDAGKSGQNILYEFRHAFDGIEKKVSIIDTWEISKLPEKSKIIFVDDIIGTGKQSVKYINNKLNLLLSSSHEIYIFSVLATISGKQYVENNTNAKVYCATELNEEKDNHYSEKSLLWTHKERESIVKINQELHNNYNYDKGLLIAFSYSVPNNTMPIIWKDNYKYNDTKNNFFALLPRKY